MADRLTGLPFDHNESARRAFSSARAAQPNWIDVKSCGGSLPPQHSGSLSPPIDAMRRDATLTFSHHRAFNGANLQESLCQFATP